MFDCQRILSNTKRRYRLSRGLCRLPWLYAALATTLLGIASPTAADSYAPVKWTKFIKVEGQSEPMPEQWLHDPEAKIAYSAYSGERDR